jgi:hypothetical protein
MGTVVTEAGLVLFGSDLSPPPSSFGVDLARLVEPRFFCQSALSLNSIFCLSEGRFFYIISRFRKNFF